MPASGRMAGMAHDHDHDHDHHHDDHDHGGHGHHHHDHFGLGQQTALAFAIGTGLNLGFVLIEATYGVLGNSIALLSDAGHNLGDTLSLGAAWAASLLAQRAPSGRYTYGLRSSSILVALFNAIILLIAVGAIVLESAERLAAPAPVAGVTVIVVALLGVLVHGATALTLSGAGLGDLNVKAAYAHMAADAAVGVAVAAAGAVILATGWVRLDPIVSIVVAVVIVVATWRLLRQALAMALQAVPDSIDGARVRDHLAHLEGVTAVHDLHIWPMSTTETALTAHLVMPSGHPGDDALARIAGSLHERFRIGHVTLQIETDPEHACMLAPDHVV
jgi:cobalt-zinc-cadmium efflux system protein